MRRVLFVPVLTLAIAGALALPALAKGPIEHASGSAVITGPGLQKPIRLKGTVEGFAEPDAGFMPLQAGEDGEFSALLFGSGLLSDQGMGQDQLEGWYVLQPDDPRALGPAYRLRFDLAGEGWSESLTGQIYPFAPERPLVFTPAQSVTIGGRVRMQHLRGLWWSAPPAVLGILQSHGLPRTAPLAAERPPATAPVPPEQPQGWTLLWTAIALFGLLVGGVLAGRGRMRVA
jgi:hypothetical protein